MLPCVVVRLYRDDVIASQQTCDMVAVFASYNDSYKKSCQSNFMRVYPLMVKLHTERCNLKDVSDKDSFEDMFQIYSFSIVKMGMCSDVSTADIFVSCGAMKNDRVLWKNSQLNPKPFMSDSFISMMNLLEDDLNLRRSSSKVSLEKYSQKVHMDKEEIESILKHDEDAHKVLSEKPEVDVDFQFLVSAKQKVDLRRFDYLASSMFLGLKK